MSAVATNFILM